ncbi:unnamed protein product, partial [Didymodactylos carnosus]
ETPASSPTGIRILPKSPLGKRKPVVATDHIELPDGNGTPHLAESFKPDGEETENSDEKEDDEEDEN